MAISKVKQFDQVKEYIDIIRPHIERHGGEILLTKIIDGVVFIKLGGACIECSEIDVTIKLGIERLLVENVSGIVKVELDNE